MTLDKESVKIDDNGSDSDETIEPEDDNMVVEEIAVEPVKEEIAVEPVKEEIAVEPVKEEVKPKSKKMGRPPKSLEEKLAKRVVVKEKIIYMIQDENGQFQRLNKSKITNKDVKQFDLKKEKEKQELELGKLLITRKNGKVDKRSSQTKRTPAQIEATRKLVELNKKKREDKKAEKKIEKKIETKEIVKESVREVVSEPFYKPQPAQAKPANPYEGLRF